MAIDRVLIAGHGNIGRRHLKLARALLPDATIKVLHYRSTDIVPEYADGSLFSIADAIQFQPEIAVVAGPSSYHVSTALPLAEAGVHLLIEKPLDAISDHIKSLLRVCAERQIVLLTGYNLRFLASLQAFRDAIQSAKIGRVCSVRCEVGQYLPDWRPGSDYRLSVSASANLGGGVLRELSQEIDYLRWIFGEVVWVKATVARQSVLEIDVEDSAFLTLGFHPGNDGSALIGTLNMDFFRHDGVRTCVAIGENGSIRWNGLTGVVDCFEVGAKEWRMHATLPPERDQSYLAEWTHFLRCVDGKEKPAVSGVDGYRTVQIIEAAKLSSLRDRTVLMDDETLP